MTTILDPENFATCSIASVQQTGSECYFDLVREIDEFKKGEYPIKKGFKTTVVKHNWNGFSLR